MKWTLIIAAVVSAAASYSSTPVFASDVSDVVRARANARAGGGTSGHDAWVLQRYGRLSGSSKRHSRSSKVKHRAALATRKKKAAASKRRAYLAKKKAAEKRRLAAIAAKQKAAEKRAQMAAKRKQQAAEKLAEKQVVKSAADALDTASVEPTDDARESTFVKAPSTAALITRQEIAPGTDTSDATGTTSVARVEDSIMRDGMTSALTNTVGTKIPADQKTAQTSAENGQGCKRFLPAIGMSISVGCGE